MPFDPKVPGHLPSNPRRPHIVPDGYSYETLKAGFEASTTLRKPKALVDMAHSPSRDNAMYPKLDPAYIKEVKRENRTREFGLSNYLPNSLKRDQSLESISNLETSVWSVGLKNGHPSRSKNVQLSQFETQKKLMRH